MLRGSRTAAERIAVYERVKIERDALAKELAQKYPTLAAQMVDLLARVATDNDAIEALRSSDCRLQPGRAGTCCGAFCPHGCAEEMPSRPFCRTMLQMPASPPSHRRH
jgi:hypothetical protein